MNKHESADKTIATIFNLFTIWGAYIYPSTYPEYSFFDMKHFFSRALIIRWICFMGAILIEYLMFNKKLFAKKQYTQQIINRIEWGSLVVLIFLLTSWGIDAVHF